MALASMTVAMNDRSFLADAMWECWLRRRARGRDNTSGHASQLRGQPELRNVPVAEMAQNCLARFIRRHNAAQHGTRCLTWLNSQGYLPASSESDTAGELPRGTGNVTDPHSAHRTEDARVSREWASSSLLGVAHVGADRFQDWRLDILARRRDRGPHSYVNAYINWLESLPDAHQEFENVLLRAAVLDGTDASTMRLPPRRLPPRRTRQYPIGGGSARMSL